MTPRLVTLPAYHRLQQGAHRAAGSRPLGLAHLRRLARSADFPRPANAADVAEGAIALYRLAELEAWATGPRRDAA